MKIYWFDRGFINQSFGVPYMPTEDEALLGFSPRVKHQEANVIGCENWRIPVLHQMIRDGHQIIWGSEREVMPSEDADFDLARIAPDFDLESFVSDRDPMLDQQVWDIHRTLEDAYMERFPAGREKPVGKRGVDPGDEDYTLGWLKERIEEKAFGVPPEVDVAIIAIVRGNPITGFEHTYITAQYLRMGVPVIWYDQDRQLAATANSMTKTGHAWPNPGIMIVGPYSVGYKWGEPITLDFPYIKDYEEWWNKHAPQKSRGAVYVGNDYERRKLMEEYLLPLSQIFPVDIWGKFDTKDADEFKAKWNTVNWAGRVETNRALSKIAMGKMTVNLIKHNYQKIGQITMRTMESPMAGTLQMGIAENIRIRDFIPADYIASSTDGAMRIARRIDAMSHAEYADELELQRDMVRRYDLHDYYMPTLYGLIDRAKEEHSDKGALALA